jgi:hypothetical protein
MEGWESFAALAALVALNRKSNETTCAGLTDDIAVPVGARPLLLLIQAGLVLLAPGKLSLAKL